MSNDRIKLSWITFLWFIFFNNWIFVDYGWAEVSDKVISIQSIIGHAVFYSCIALVLNFLLPKVFGLTFLSTLFLSAKGVFVVLDRSVGPAVISEQGIRYMLFAYGALLVVFLVNILGLVLGLKK